MADVFDAKKLSEIMKNVHPNKNKTTELKLIELFKNIIFTDGEEIIQLKVIPILFFLIKDCGIC